jgi:hypothetical protein
MSILHFVHGNVGMNNVIVLLSFFHFKKNIYLRPLSKEALRFGNQQVNLEVKLKKNHF